MLKKRSGSTLVTALLISSILLVILVTYIARIVLEFRLTAKSYGSAAAISLCEAGIERAIWELNYNGGTFPGWNIVVGGGGERTISRTFASFQNSSGNAVGDFTVTANLPSTNTPAVIRATSFVPRQALADAQRTVQVIVNNSLFYYGVFGDGSVSLTGHAATDSYDSQLGPYGSQPHGTEGDVASNGDITLSGQAQINGDATPGPGHLVSEPTAVTGSTIPASTEIELDPIPSSYLTGTTDLVLNSNNILTLTTGDYYYRSISITAQAKIIISGTVNIYVNGGNIVIAGQGIVNNGSPLDLTIYSSGTDINLAGGSDFTGTIYAPQATITLSGQSDIYGAIIGNEIADVGQGEIHFDLALKDKYSSIGKYRTITWQEIE